ncbi:MAG TPA: class I SAM-dependent methyltransferase [Deltaproteobacteria bacterium]|nr:class I SAM-dependent methyltransferase [Deltaproteobacteria bacterium]
MGRLLRPTRGPERLGLSPEVHDAVEFGSGYGTFTIPAARMIQGSLHAFDIDTAMVERVREKLEPEDLTNVSLHLKDFVEEGTGLPEGATDYAMLFNILHVECPETLLGEAWRVIRHSGRLAVMHWRYDPTTPRGPSMAIRPRPEQCRSWSEGAGFVADGPGEIIDLPLYHYGMVMRKP